MSTFGPTRTAEHMTLSAFTKANDAELISDDGGVGTPLTIASAGELKSHKRSIGGPISAIREASLIGGNAWRWDRVRKSFACVNLPMRSPIPKTVRWKLETELKSRADPMPN
jgi:hypothetical protein